MKRFCELDRLQDTDRDFLISIKPLFEENANIYIENLLKAIELNDDENVKYFSHKMLGSSLSMSAKILAEICKNIETEIDKTTPDYNLIKELSMPLKESLKDYFTCLDKFLQNKRENL